MFQVQIIKYALNITYIHVRGYLLIMQGPHLLFLCVVLQHFKFSYPKTKFLVSDIKNLVALLYILYNI